MTNKPAIAIRVNDLSEQVPEGTSLETIIQQHDERDPDLIVELNGRFIYPKDYATTRVNAGDEIELINPDFGG